MLTVFNLQRNFRIGGGMGGGSQQLANSPIATFHVTNSQKRCTSLKVWKATSIKNSYLWGLGFSLLNLSI